MDKSRSFKKGSDFEISLFMNLSMRLRGSLVMHNVHIPAGNNSAQIDLLVVKGWSFYVLELKNYEHRLQGTLHDKMWLATSSNRNYDVQNPLSQNLLQQLRLTNALKTAGFTAPVENNGFIVVPPSCRVDTPEHLKNRIITIDDFYGIAKKSKPGEGDIARLRETLLRWKM